MKQMKMSSPIGDLYLVSSDNGLTDILWQCQPQVQLFEEDTFLSSCKRQLEKYFAGSLKKFEIPFDLKGTEFQKKVWKELCTIPYGETCSYKDIAKSINNDSATRAVGSANGKNPLCIVIPCHRVIASDGTLGGYSGGLDKKKLLLAVEGKWPLKNL